MEIGLFEVIRFCTLVMIKKTHYMYQGRMFNFFHDVLTNFSPKNVSYG